MNEEGRIVRIVTIEGRIGYAVTILNNVSKKEIEALWRPQDLIELEGRCASTAASAHRATKCELSNTDQKSAHGEPSV
jgi:hypothetical protein